MSWTYFADQMRRMKSYFTNGSAVYSRDRLTLIWSVVKDLPDESMRQIVDVFVGENTPDWPPRVSDFREKAAEQRQAIFREECRKANMTFKEEARKREGEPDGLRKTLEELGVKSLMEAIQKKKTTNQEGA